MSRSRLPLARGFSLVEVMVSLVIIAVGMLGLAKIQALAYASTGVASQQSLAAMHAASIASAMRANRNYWSAVSTTAAFSYSAAGSAAPVTTDATLTTVYNCNAGGGDAPCTSANKVAAFDLQSWVATINLTLPNPTATITCAVPAPAASPIGCWVQITWMEENVAINTNAVGNTMTAPTYTLYVVP